MFIPTNPAIQHSSPYGPLPIYWTGKEAPTATNYFAKAPIGSRYIYRVSSTEVREYIKTKHTPAASDWAVVASTNSDEGFIPVPLSGLRELGTGSFINAAGNGGLLATDTTPILNTVNGDTDGAWRVSWAASNSDAVGFNVTLPNDFKGASDVLIKFRAAMAGATNTPTLSCDSYFNEGDTKITDATGAVTGTAYAEYTATVAAADVPAGARTLSVEVTPGAHTTDALYLTAVWVEYERK